MEQQIIEFISRVDERKNSAQIKLQLLVYGIQDAAELFSAHSIGFKEEHYAYDNGNWGVDKKRLVPTEILLPGGIVSKLHIRSDSPYKLGYDKGTLYIVKNEKCLSEAMFLKRPTFWNFKTRSGKDTKCIAQIYGLNALNFNIFSGCEFHNVGLGCKFCSVKSTVDSDSMITVHKEIEDLVDVCEYATKYDKPKYLIMTGGSYVNREIEWQRNIAILHAIREKLPWNNEIKGNVSFLPPKNIKALKDLYDLKVENPSFNIEVWPETNFRRICPGKSKYVGFHHIVKSLLYLRDIYGAGRVWSNFVAGIVSLEDLKDGFKFMAENGIVPGANIYHAEVGSFIGNSLGPIDENYILELYHYTAELYHKYGYKPYFDTCVLRNSIANEVYEGLL